MSPRFVGAALLALACSLGSCSTLKTVAGLAVSPKSIAVAVQAFDAVEASAATYLRLSDCAEGQSTLSDACKQPSIVPVLIKDVRAGRAARDSLWTDSKTASSGIGVKAAYDAVIAATAAIRQDLSH